MEMTAMFVGVPNNIDKQPRYLLKEGKLNSVKFVTICTAIKVQINNKTKLMTLEEWNSLPVEKPEDAKQ